MRGQRRVYPQGELEVRTGRREEKCWVLRTGAGRNTDPGICATVVSQRGTADLASIALSRTEQVLIKGEKRKGEAPGKPKIGRIVVGDVPLQGQIEGENGIRCHQALSRQKPYGLFSSGLPEHHGCQNRSVCNHRVSAGHGHHESGWCSHPASEG